MKKQAKPAPAHPHKAPAWYLVFSPGSEMKDAEKYLNIFDDVIMMNICQDCAQVYEDSGRIPLTCPECGAKPPAWVNMIISTTEYYYQLDQSEPKVTL